MSLGRPCRAATQYFLRRGTIVNVLMRRPHPRCHARRLAEHHLRPTILTTAADDRMIAATARPAHITPAGVVRRKARAVGLPAMVNSASSLISSGCVSG